MQTQPNVKGHNVTQFLHVKGSAPLEIGQLVFSEAHVQQKRC
jgi:hypothetical protein